MVNRSLEEVFEAFDLQNVLIVGDVMIDSYVWGDVNRISPEAPVPVLHTTKKEKRLGGAANVAKNIQALGASPFLCSVIGDDAEAYDFIKILEQREIRTSGIIRSDRRHTTVKERLLSGSQHMLRVDSEHLQEIDQDDEKKLLDKIKEFIPDINVIIFEDYDKGILNQRLITETINLAKKFEVPTVVDPKKNNFLTYKDSTLFKPNLKEIREGLKMDFVSTDMDSLKHAAEKLIDQMRLKLVMVTLSERGIYIKNKGESHHLPAHIRSISDVSGAGDTVTSIAALCLALGLVPEFIAALSNLGGGLVCEHQGVVPIDKDNLLKEAKAEELKPSQAELPYF
ncbi:bifunctional heptose 7-phosphate kinase/heptose 1-phosphate adenyltransferase [Bacteroidota bacterium]